MKAPRPISRLALAVMVLAALALPLAGELALKPALERANARLEDRKERLSQDMDRARAIDGKMRDFREQQARLEAALEAAAGMLPPSDLADATLRGLADLPSKHGLEVRRFEQGPSESREQYIVYPVTIEVWGTLEQHALLLADLIHRPQPAVARSATLAGENRGAEGKMPVSYRCRLELHLPFQGPVP